MAIITIVVGDLLILLGVVGYFLAEPARRSPTALIPALIGLLLEICGVLALRPNLRKHAMHAAVVIATLGLLAAGGRLAMTSARGNPPVGLALFSQAGMSLICLIFVILCVRSFMAARQERERERERAGFPRS